YLGKAEGAHRPTPALYTLRGNCHKSLGDEAAAEADTQLAAETPPMMALDHYLRGQAAYDALLAERLPVRRGAGGIRRWTKARGEGGGEWPASAKDVAEGLRAGLAYGRGGEAEGGLAVERPTTNPGPPATAGGVVHDQPRPECYLTASRARASWASEMFPFRA